MLKIRKLLIVLIALAIFKPSPAMCSEGEPMTLREAAVFYASVVRHVINNYVESVSIDKLLEGALHGMLNSLDPNCDYLTPKQYEEIQNQNEGKYAGIGIEVTLDDGRVKIVSPLEDAPAFNSGVKPGDFITKVDEKPVLGMYLHDVVDLLKGDPGTNVKVGISRKDLVDFDVIVTRAIIDVEPVKSEVKDDVIYIRISTFNNKTTKQIKGALERHLAELGNKSRGIILDLRNNFGGLLEEAIGASNLFLPSGSLIVSIKGRKKDSEMKFISQEDDQARGLPIVVLINGGSASSSEILAGAIKYNKRGIVVGTKSFGKGSVQKVAPLSNGGAIKLTEALYYTPDGQSIDNKGIEPNIIIEQPAEKEVDKDKKDQVPLTDKDKVKPIDYQLEQAITIIKGMKSLNTI